MGDDGANDPRCAWHDPGIPQAKLRPQPCIHFPDPVEEELRATIARLRAIEEAARAMAPNEPDCTCDRDDDSDPGGPVVLCEKHERMLRPLRWDTLAMMVVDLLAHEAALRAALATAKEAGG